MPKIGELFIDISANNSKLRANLAEASSLIRDWSLLVTGLTGGITNAFRTITDVGIAGVKIGMTALVASFGLAAKSGADFEDAMVRAFTVLSESSENARASFSTLTETARTLGRETLFSATDAAEGMQILAKAGFDAREIIDSIRPSLNLAIVGNMELGESAQFTVNALRGFNLETNQAGRVADVLALGSSQAATTISELGSALSFVAPVAAGVGLSFEETIASLGILANAGIRASKAGTTLRRALTQLVSPTGQAKEILDELGLSFVDSSGKVKPMTMVIRELNAAGVTAAQTMQIFGLRAGPGMIALMRAGANAVGGLESKLRDADGAAERMAQNFRTTVKGRTRDLMASIVDLGLSFSEEFKGPLADTIFAIRNFIVDIVKTGNRLGLFKALITGVGTALEPVKELIKDLAERFKVFLQNLTADDVLSFFDNLREKIQGFIDSLVGGELNSTIMETLSAIQALGSGVLGIARAIKTVWETIPESIRPSVTAIGLVSAGIVALFGGVLNLITLFISLDVVAKAFLGRLLILPLIGKAAASVWGGLIILFKSILLPAVAAIAGLLAGLTIGRLLSEMETWKALIDVIKSQWDVIISNIELAIAKTKLFFKANSENADRVVAAQEERLRTGKNLDQAKLDLAGAGFRDTERQNQLISNPLETSKELINSTLSDLAGIFETKLPEAIGNALSSAQEGAEELGKGRTSSIKVDLGGGTTIDLSGSPEEVRAGFQELSNKLREKDDKVVSLMGNMVSGLDGLSGNVENIMGRLQGLESQVNAQARQVGKPVKDENTRSSIGATYE